MHQTTQGFQIFCIDRTLLYGSLLLCAIGLLMVASSSIVISQKLHAVAFHYLFHQLAYLALGVAVGLFIMRQEMHTWFEISRPLLFISFCLMVCVFIPHVGITVNGSARWIGWGPLRFQSSEWLKLSLLIYLSAYLTRFDRQVQNDVVCFARPMVMLLIAVGLLLLEPDFGTGVVILLTSMGLLFVAGGRLRYFIALLLATLMGIAVVAVSAPYRVARLTTFLNPWAVQYDSGYQLTQSLIAFGRGGWFGTGLGAGIQKLFYLPEAHTDFIFAVIGEELGVFGILVVVSCFVVIVIRALQIGKKSMLSGALFNGYLAMGIGLYIALQAMISMGVNTGLLPTKGLTLPLVSYGGNSLLVMCIALALLFRIDYENRTR